MMFPQPPVVVVHEWWMKHLRDESNRVLSVRWTTSEQKFEQFFEFTSWLGRLTGFRCLSVAALFFLVQRASRIEMFAAAAVLTHAIDRMRWVSPLSSQAFQDVEEEKMREEEEGREPGGERQFPLPPLGRGRSSPPELGNQHPPSNKGRPRAGRRLSAACELSF